jgi:hypothetical protein
MSAATRQRDLINFTVALLLGDDECIITILQLIENLIRRIYSVITIWRMEYKLAPRK